MPLTLVDRFHPRRRKELQRGLWKPARCSGPVRHDSNGAILIAPVATSSAVQTPPETPDWEAVRDRLQRAASINERPSDELIW